MTSSALGLLAPSDVFSRTSFTKSLGSFTGPKDRDGHGLERLLVDGLGGTKILGFVEELSGDKLLALPHKINVTHYVTT